MLVTRPGKHSSASPDPRYRHRQFGWMLILCATLPVATLVVLYPLARGGATELLPRIFLPSVIGLSFLIVLLFGSLEVSITREALLWRFGIGWVRGRVALTGIDSVRVVRTRPSAGFGIRRMRDGWLYTVGGQDALEIALRSGRIVQIGSDEVHGLCHALENALAQASRLSPSPREALGPAAIQGGPDRG